MGLNSGIKIASDAIRAEGGSLPTERYPCRFSLIGNFDRGNPHQ